jgi:hypothetical protein
VENPWGNRKMIYIHGFMMDKLHRDGAMDGVVLYFTGLDHGEIDDEPLQQNIAISSEETIIPD